jgi:nucleoside-diphosphate-sugar epimerase
MKSAIVTGAAGFVGTHLVNELLSHGIEVTALCRVGSRNTSRLPDGVRIEYKLDALPRADVFYHLAWESASGAGRANAELQSRNATFTITTLEAAAGIGCGKFIALGTIYEKLSSQVTASGAFGGSDFYILSKEYAHVMADKLAYKLGIDFTWCTVCHPFGSYVKREQMLASVIEKLRLGESMDFGPGREYYDITAAADLACGLRLAGGTAARRREYFIGSGTPRILREYIEETRRVLGGDASVIYDARPDDGLRFKREWFDITPLSRDVGYAPKTQFAEMVKKYITHLEEYKNAENI